MFSALSQEVRKPNTSTASMPAVSGMNGCGDGLRGQRDSYSMSFTMSSSPSEENCTDAGAIFHTPTRRA